VGLAARQLKLGRVAGGLLRRFSPPGGLSQGLLSLHGRGLVACGGFLRARRPTAPASSLDVQYSAPAPCSLRAAGEPMAEKFAPDRVEGAVSSRPQLDGPLLSPDASPQCSRPRPGAEGEAVR
jgi:hypothetical protein